MWRQGENRGLDRAAGGARRGAGRDPDRDNPQLPAVPLPGRDPVAELGGVEADREVGFDRDPRDLASGSVDAGGDIAGNHGHPTAVDRLDRRRGRFARLAGKSGPEDRIDNRARVGQPSIEIRRHLIAEDLHHLHLEPHPPEVSSSNLTVAPVVPLAADDPHRPLRRKPRNRLRQGRPRRLHQLRRRNPLLLNRPAIDGPNPLGVKERLQPRLHGRSLKVGLAWEDWPSAVPFARRTWIRNHGWMERSRRSMFGSFCTPCVHFEPRNCSNREYGPVRGVGWPSYERR